MSNPSPRKKSIVLLSGGLDSSANLAFCQEFDHPILALTAKYGQRASESEVRAAQAISRFYDVPHQTVDLDWLGRLGGSSLTEASLGVPSLQTEKLDDPDVVRETARAVWVPNRNGVLINVAAAFAERLGAEQVVVGFNVEEAVTFPDNSLEFLNRSNLALKLSTASAVQVQCYTSSLTKREIVQELKKLLIPFPYELLWSCYQGGDRPCGVCESCLRMSRAFS